MYDKKTNDNNIYVSNCDALRSQMLSMRYHNDMTDGYYDWYDVWYYGSVCYDSMIVDWSSIGIVGVIAIMMVVWLL